MSKGLNCPHCGAVVDVSVNGSSEVVETCPRCDWITKTPLNNHQHVPVERTIWDEWNGSIRVIVCGICELDLTLSKNPNEQVR